MAFWKESMINRLSNLINRNRSAAKISQVLCSSTDSALKRPLILPGHGRDSKMVEEQRREGLRFILPLSPLPAL